MDNIINSGNNEGIIAGTVIINHSNIKRIPALMPKLIEKLSSIIIHENSSFEITLIPETYDIQSKIDYNNLEKYKGIVDEYGTYYRSCESALTAIDNDKPNSKSKLLNSINDKYKTIKRENPISSDAIIDKLILNLKDEIASNYDDEDFVIEDINFNLAVFLCYSFVECKILERPPK